MDSYYAGWLVWDAKLLGFVMLISLFFTLGVVALVFRGRRWHEYVTAFVSIYAMVLVTTVLVFNCLAEYPVFLFEDVFPFQ